MTFTRRKFLASVAAGMALPRLATANEFATLTAQIAYQQLAPSDYPKTEIWGFDGTTPGPEIRVAQGARVRRHLANLLPQATSVHWHGIRIDNAMDGVPGLTQDAVPPGEQFTYDFVAPDAGTYWYHAHNRSFEQVARGLYGALIVEEPDAPDVDHDLALTIDDWRLDQDTLAIAEPFENFHDLSHAGRLGNIASVNGQFDPATDVRRHDRLRLRLINAANARIFDVGLSGFEGWLVALDGMPLETPVRVTGAFTLAPAQRADLIVDVTAEAGESADLLSVERDGGYGLMQFNVGPGAQARRPDPAPLAPNAMPALTNAVAAPLHTLTMQGGAMRGLPPSQLRGITMQPRELAELGKFWALNGIVDRAKDPFLSIEKGTLHRIALVNETAFPHAMHLHGHHFRAISDDGTLGPWRDTLLVQPNATRQIALLGDNPGDWLLHCHMLGHAMAGMTTWFRVT
ncbi:multicopper oxidase family protein [Arenibacterium sp. CAU 1754]